MNTKIWTSRSAASLFVALVLMAGGTTLFAQSQASTGQIVGNVIDQSGGAIPGAQITATNKATGLTRTVLTSDNGFYRIVLLPPGAYEVLAENPGFQKSAQTVAVNVGTTINANFNLKVGGVTEVVQVSAQAVVETTRSESGAVVNETAIRDLPINGRRFQDFIILTPTVVVEPQRNQLSFGGQRGINGNINIDGADYNEPFFGGIRGGERSNNAFTIPQESIGEFQVISSGYTAEFGRSTGGIVNAVTKSGTNEIHGSAFYLLRHKELGKRNALKQLAITTQQQFGGSFGGPIRRDKSFGFFAAERQEVSNPRQVRFTQLLSVARSSANGEAFDLYKSFEQPFTQTNDATALLGRIDHEFTSNHRLSGRYNFSDNNAENATSTGAAIDPLTSFALSNNGTEKDRTHTGAGQLTSIFNANLLNEFRIQYSREQRPRLANAQQPTVSNTIGRFGTVNFLPTTLTDYRVQISDSLTWNRGAHSVKVGFEYNHTNADQTFAFNQFGAFNLSGSNINTLLEIMSLTPGAATDNRFDSTAATYLRQIGNGLLVAGMDELGFFAQDSWRIRPNFTLNYGVRYEGQLNPEADTSNTTLTNRVLESNFPLGKVDPRQIPDNTDQFMPRIGFAWDPFNNSRTVIRSNFGLYYARTPLLLFAAPLNNFRLPPGDLSIQLPLRVPAGNTNNTVYKQLLATGIDLNKFTLDKLPIITAADVQRVAGALGLSFDPYAGVQPITWAGDYKNPRATQWNLGFEHEIKSGLSTGAEFTYINTVHLQRNRDYNQPVPIIRSTDKSLRPFFGLRTGTSRPNTLLGSLQVRQATARSLFQGVTFRASLRRSRLQFNAYYTASWNSSDDDNERDAGGVGYMNVYSLSDEYGPGRLDSRHKFVMNAVGRLPFNVEASGIVRLQSAFPFDATTGADTNEDIGGPDRPFSAPGVPFGRNAFRNRAFYTTDFRVMKGFNLGNDATKVQLSFEFFNLFNNDNVQIGSRNFIYGLGIDPASGSTLAPSSTFRRLRLADGSYDPNNNPGAPFQMQVGLRVLF